jgi:Prion-inhibition and propagation
VKRNPNAQKTPEQLAEGSGEAPQIANNTAQLSPEAAQSINTQTPGESAVPSLARTPNSTTSEQLSEALPATPVSSSQAGPIAQLTRVQVETISETDGKGKQQLGATKKNNGNSEKKSLIRRLLKLPPKESKNRLTSVEIEPNKRTSTDQQKPKEDGPSEPKLYPSAEALLHIPAVKKAGIEVENQAKKLQNQADLLQKAKWVKSVSDKFYGYIKQLKELIDDLEYYLREKSSPGESGTQVALSEQGAALLSGAEQLQNALERLHRALRGMNKRKDPWILSLQLQEDFKSAGQGFISMADDFRLRPGSLYFTLQRQQSPGSEESELFVAETLLEDRSNVIDDVNATERCLSLQRASKFVNESSDDVFEQWGIAQTGGSPGDKHWLFRDSENQWKFCGTLASSLSLPEPKAKLTRIQRLSLALMVAKSYLHLMTVRPQCDPIGLDRLTYYVEKEEEPDKWNNKRPLILRPYITFGFGQRPAGKAVVGGATSSTTTRTPIYDLGVILIHIALCEFQSFGSGGDSHAQARSWALTKLRQAELLLSLPFAELVRNCLQYRESTASADDAKAEAQFLVRTILALLELKARLNGSLAGSAVPI